MGVIDDFQSRYFRAESSFAKHLSTDSFFSDVELIISAASKLDFPSCATTSTAKRLFTNVFVFGPIVGMGQSPFSRRRILVDLHLDVNT